jgi:formylmethanofuran dehydrogenase subunit E
LRGYQRVAKLTTKKQKSQEAKEYARTYYLQNKERLILNAQDWQKRNKEKNKENQKAYYEANKDRISKNGKAYREANKDRIKAYYEANKPVCQNCGEHVPSLRKASVQGRQVWLCTRCILS